MSMVVHEYELFIIKKDENISEMSTRFTNIVNCLKSLGKIYTNEENVRKILRSLPKRWEAEKTAYEIKVCDWSSDVCSPIYIVNSLKALGKIYTNQENVRKILRSLPKRWEAKI